MSKVALYARVSTRDKDQDPDTQLYPLREWAESNGMEAVEYVDYASGKNLNRTDWKRMEAAVRKREVSAVAVLRLDRAFRSVIDMHTTLAEWDARGIRFIALTQPIDTGSAVGRLTLSVLGAIAEFERAMTVERVNEGLSRARKQGVKLGRPRTRLSAERAQRALEEHGSLRAAAIALGVSKDTLARRVSQKADSKTLSRTDD